MIEKPPTQGVGVQGFDAFTTKRREITNMELSINLRNALKTQKFLDKIGVDTPEDATKHLYQLFGAQDWSELIKLGRVDLIELLK